MDGCRPVFIIGENIRVTKGKTQQLMANAEGSERAVAEARAHHWPEFGCLVRFLDAKFNNLPHLRPSKRR